MAHCAGPTRAFRCRLHESDSEEAVRADLERRLRSADNWVIARLPEFYGPNVANPLMGGPFRAALAKRPILRLGGRLEIPPTGKTYKITMATFPPRQAAAIEWVLRPSRDRDANPLPDLSRLTSAQMELLPVTVT